MNVGDKTPAERKAAALERRAKREATLEEARDAQEAVDLEAIEALELEHGYTLNVEFQVQQFVPGFPTIVAIRPPSEAEYKRYFAQVNKANGSGDAKVAAHVMLAQVSWVYPAEPEARRAMLAANGGMLASIGNHASKLAELRKSEEGKS
jgi:hypothetical protein